jgi:hypothetical protein
MVLPHYEHSSETFLLLEAFYGFPEEFLELSKHSKL